MTKAEALTHFLEPGETLGEHQAQAIQRMAAHFGISRAAIYMWPDDKVPELRRMQAEQYAAAQAVKRTLAAAHPDPSLGAMDADRMRVAGGRQ